MKIVKKINTLLIVPISIFFIFNIEIFSLCFSNKSIEKIQEYSKLSIMFTILLVFTIILFIIYNVMKKTKCKWSTVIFQYIRSILVFIIIYIIFDLIKKVICINNLNKFILFIPVLLFIGYYIAFILIFNTNEKNTYMEYFKFKLYRNKSKKIEVIIIVIIIFVLCLNILYNSLNFQLLHKNKNIGNKIINISFDDTIEIFRDLTLNENKYNSIFENDTLNFLKNMNEHYDAKFAMFVFYEFNGFKLSETTSKFQKEFSENADWLKFGFHALNSKQNLEYESVEETVKSYNLVIDELKRIVSNDAITNVVRMEKFLSNRENIIAIKEQENGIIGLLGADTFQRKDYYLSVEENLKLFIDDYFMDNETGIFFYNTDMRLENCLNFYEDLDKLKNDENLIIFTHEWALNDNIKSKIELICKYINEKNYEFSFMN